LRETTEDPRFVPNVLNLQGGQNDALITTPDENQTATAQTIEAARRLWLGVQTVARHRRLAAAQSALAGTISAHHGGPCP
jgi:hypothetical protein